MTTEQVVTVARWVWLIGGIGSVLLAFWALARAKEDHAQHIRESGNGAVLHAGRWRILASSLELLKALTITVAALLALIDAVDPGPNHFGLIVLGLLALWPVEFAVKLATDAYNHQKLLNLITTVRGSPENRKMDEHTVSERVE